LVAVALLAMALLPACYTLFRHPRLQQLNYRRPESNRCQTCHASQELWRYTHPSTMPARTGPWGAFYDTPWWFDRRWDVGPAPGRDGARADSTRAREGEPVP
jgi:hypothetical protein